MTTKEEANKLCMDFLMDMHTDEVDYGMNKELAKQCALKSIHETLLLLEHIEERINDGFIYSLKSRYMKIRTEIKKI